MSQISQTIGSKFLERLMVAKDRLVRLARLEPTLYACVTATWILLMASWFYGSMRWQLYNSIAWAQGASYDPSQRPNLVGLWSAPLDDVFIHFDFARSTARGFPFQWIDGNGYSSGGTSLLYPFVLAIGLLVGFRGLTLMHFAASLASVCVFATAIGLRRAFADLPRAASYLLPFALLGVGALSWSLFSGMELSLFMALWTGAVLTQHELSTRVQAGAALPRFGCVRLALWNMALVATRPESLVLVAVLAGAVAWHLWRRQGAGAAGRALLTMTLPASSVTLSQALANRWLTGDFAAAGALVKLEMYSPHMTWQAVVKSYFSFLQYQVMRVTERHFSDVRYVGWVIWVLAAVALLPKATRYWARLLWCSWFGWVAVVALNGQVRWQNERYTMPAVAFLLIAAALGLGFILTLPLVQHRRRGLACIGSGTGLALLAIYVYAQWHCTVGQVWFFGRASRNIFDQQLQVGHRLGHLLNPMPHRVAMGDAGAIPYAADIPGLDLIGLGGTNNLPFARAAGWGLGATVELIQRLPKDERPDVFAIYPSWWHELPLWFSDGIIEGASSTARGNVICGGPTKVAYHADFSALDDAETPTTLKPGEQIKAALDFGDIVSERAHAYRISKPWLSYVGMKKLPNPRDAHLDLWDASRIVDPGLDQTFTLSGLIPGRPARLIFRIAPPVLEQVRIKVQGKDIGVLDLPASDQWLEPSMVVAAALVAEKIKITITTSSSAAAELFHLWATQSP